MNFKALLGAVMIGFGGYLLFGQPGTAEWPSRLGPYAVWAMKACISYLPYTGILSIALGLAIWMTLKT